MRTVERLSRYRRVLTDPGRQAMPYVFSHTLASLVQVTPSQVRRDIMGLGCAGNPTRGYRVEELLAAIAQVVDDNQPQPVILVGIGKLGSALINYFRGHRPNLQVVAAFDNNPDKVNRIFQGVRCYPLDELPRIVAAERVQAAILAVPAAAAQEAAHQIVFAGVSGILNFAPAPLFLPAHVHVESIDLTTALEKVLFHTRHQTLSTVVLNPR
jgi:redox-sensing transcriptional repressor